MRRRRAAAQSGFSSPAAGLLNVRLGSELHAAVVTAAKAEQSSINSWIVRVLREAIATSSGSSGTEGPAEIGKPIVL